MLGKEQLNNFPLVKDLTLWMLHETGWSEDSRNKFGVKVFMTWKGYDYDVLKELELHGMIKQIESMIVLKEAGLQKATEIRQQFNEIIQKFY